MSLPERFVWFDYETINITPFGGAASQFAAIVTDSEFNVLEEHDFFCKLSEDTIPELGACLVTGINPKNLLEESENVLCEFDFVSKINEIFMGRGKSCSIGYNSTKFDDEWTRNLLYRNLKDPYEWAWKNGNSRFDAMNLAQLTFALAPEILNWDFVDAHDAAGNVVGKRPSFRLEILSASNGIEHENSHNALSDVKALVYLVKMIKERAPEVFSLAMEQRDKKAMTSLLSNPTFVAVGNRSREIGYATLATTIGFYPSSNGSKACAWDLTVDPTPFLGLSDEVKTKMKGLYGSELLDLGFPHKMGSFSVKTNGIPNIASSNVFANVGAFTPSDKLIGMRNEIRDNLQLVRENQHELMELLIFLERDFEHVRDSDMEIYSGGFFSPAEKGSAKDFCELSSWGDRIAFVRSETTPKRIKELGFRVVARCSPEVLNEDERASWTEYKASRFNGTALNQPKSRDGEVYSMHELLREIEESDSDNLDILNYLRDYASSRLVE